MTKWDESYSVGIKQFDEEHKVLFDIIQQLGRSIVNVNSKEKLEEVLLRIVDYATTHFASEERLMKEHGYPNLDEHLAEHEVFTKVIDDFQDQLEKGRSTLSTEVFKTLIKWLNDHFKNADAKYALFLNSKGIY